MLYVEITNEEIEHTNTFLQGFQFTCFNIQPRRDRRLATTRYFIEFSLEFSFSLLNFRSLW